MAAAGRAVVLAQPMIADTRVSRALIDISARSRLDLAGFAPKP
jgi:hypothetical protein